jgi:nucleoid-associated protein YgaU
MALGAVVVFGLASAFISTGAFASNPEPAQQVIPRTVIAKSGDTLWDIARQIVPKGAIGDLVSEMVQLNGSVIEPGQVVRIP